MNLDPIIRAVQKAVNATPDGKPGPDTWVKIYNATTGKTWMEAAAPSGEKPNGVVDARSEKNILSLLPKVQGYARALIHAAQAQGIKIVVTSGSRTFAEQDALFAQGRSNPGAKVTNARGGFSNHNFGVAFDVTIFSGSKPVWESPAYKAVGAIGRALGLEWGGDWKTIKDEPHFQLRPAWAADLPEREFLAALRLRKAEGMAVFA